VGISSPWALKNKFYIIFHLYRNFFMATTSISSNISNISNHQSRMVTITVTGIQQQLMRISNQTLSVPYNRLSQTMRNIHRVGGKVVDVSMQTASASSPSVNRSSKVSEPDNADSNNPAAKKKKK
jgi:phycocyanin-associated, rod